MSKAIADLLTRYYQAPHRLQQLRRDCNALERRVALLTSEVGDASLQPLADSTLPGIVARYGKSGGASNAVSNPVLAMILRLESCETRAMVQLREARVELLEKEQESDELQALVEDMDDALSNLAPGDRQLIALRYRDRKTNEQIAIVLESYADESGPRKRLDEIEANLTRALSLQPVAVLRRRLTEPVPNRSRKIAENRELVLLS